MGFKGLVRDQEVGGPANRCTSNQFQSEWQDQQIRIVAGPRSHRNVKLFIPIYPDTLPTVPKHSRSSRTAPLVVNNLEASQSAITRLLNLPALFALADFYVFSVLYAPLSCTEITSLAVQSAPRVHQ